MSKKALSESDIYDRYITPGIVAAGWEMTMQMYHEFGFTAGRIIARGQRKRADHLLLYHHDLPIPVIEAFDSGNKKYDRLWLESYRELETVVGRTADSWSD